MGQVRVSVLFAVAAAAVTAFSSVGSVQASSCGMQLLLDWRDGRIDRTYEVECYREALATMPEDVLVYSTAEDDLTRELQAQLRTERAAKAGAAVVAELVAAAAR
jgi:hypothetical protein